MENLEQYKNRFVYQKWEHNGGYKSNWLRRINRTTKTQLISDCQRGLILDGGKNDSRYGIFHK